jgi:hypothetical protein
MAINSQLNQQGRKQPQITVVEPSITDSGEESVRLPLFETRNRRLSQAVKDIQDNKKFIYANFKRKIVKSNGSTFLSDPNHAKTAPIQWRLFILRRLSSVMSRLFKTFATTTF